MRKLKRNQLFRGRHIALPLVMGSRRVIRWSLPDRLGSQLPTSKLNRYLRHQQDRIIKAIDRGDLVLAFRMFTSLAQNSYVFRTMWICRIMKGWYWSTNTDQLNKILVKLDRIIRQWDGNLRSYRVYIPKANGKIRPLGVPTVEWRIYTAMWADMLYMVLSPHLAEWQHGFVRGKGTMTAWLEIWKTFEKGDNIWEFDLDGFFNRVSPSVIAKYLERVGVPGYIISLIMRVNSMPPLMHPDEIQEEKEMIPEMNGLMSEEIVKSGLPQGLPWSPLLSIFLVSMIFKEKGIRPIMYADDGIFITKTSENPLVKIDEDDDIYEAGIFLSEKLKKDGRPSCGKCEGILDFLGLQWRYGTDEVLMNGIWKRRELLTEREISNIVWKNYDPNAPREFNWDIREGSYIVRTQDVLTWRNIKNWWLLLLNWLVGASYPIKVKGLIAYNYQELSSEAAYYLLRKIQSMFKQRRPQLTTRPEAKYGGETERYFLSHQESIYSWKWDAIRKKLNLHALYDIIKRGQLMNRYYGQVEFTLRGAYHYTPKNSADRGSR